MLHMQTLKQINRSMHTANVRKPIQFSASRTRSQMCWKTHRDKPYKMSSLLIIGRTHNTAWTNSTRPTWVDKCFHWQVTYKNAITDAVYAKFYALICW